jgi:hypothetical protein
VAASGPKHGCLTLRRGGMAHYSTIGLSCGYMEERSGRVIYVLTRRWRVPPELLFKKFEDS